MLTTLTALRHALTAARTRALAARHLGASPGVVLRAAFGDVRAFLTPPRPAAPAAPAQHHGARGVRL